jgi:UDP-N-acetylmuramate--alanine ligase
LKLSPILAVVTNIDREHLDTYRDLEDIERTFIDFMDRVPFYGAVIVCNDNDRLRALLPRLERRAITYGMRADSDFRVSGYSTELSPDGKPTSRFHIEYRGVSLGDFRLHAPGAHNVLNAAAAVAVGIGLDVSPDDIRAGLESFSGVDRRLQLHGQAAGISVLDDYGHHPTEIRATLAAARQCGYRKIHVIFQPHRYTRTHLLMDDFGTAFADADSVCVLDIYPASEPPIPGVTGEALARRISRISGREVCYLSSFEDAVAFAVSVTQPGDMILTLGAGSVSQLGPQIVDALRARESHAAAQ